MQNIGLVLEGGGLRGVYTSGVLNYFMKKDLYFPYVIGVSMGACNAVNYLAKQPERNKTVNIDYVKDPRYLSMRRWLLNGELFGMKFIFDTIPNSLNLFDYDTFYNNKAEFIIPVTDCISGETIYFSKNELGNRFMDILQASSSLPLISKPVVFNEKILMDGGISDSVPIKKSIIDGNIKNVLILTQPKEYRKKPEPMMNFVKFKYKNYNGLITALSKRHTTYNETMDYIEELNNQGKIFIIRPQKKLQAGRVERNKHKLYGIYDQGYSDAKDNFSSLIHFLNS